MPEIKIPMGKFSIDYSCFKGYTAPDETVTRPVNPESVEEVLYSRKKASLQPVQVEIPEGLRIIGYGAFEDCRGLTGVSIPNTIIEIGERAFRSCTALTHVTLPDSVEVIQPGAFQDCTALTRICVPDSVKTIGQSVFAGCTGLQEITIPDALCEKAVQLFGDLEWVSWRWLEGRLKVNPALGAFFGAYLKRYRWTITEDLISREDGENLRRYLDLWDKVPLDFLDGLIEKSMDIKKPGLTAVLLQCKNDKYLRTQCCTEKEADLCNRSAAEWSRIFVWHDEGGELVIDGCVQCDGAVEVPTMIGNKPVVTIAHWIPTGMKETEDPYTVVLPEGLREIREGAFQECNMKAITIPNTVKKIGKDTFRDCRNLEEVVIPFGVKRIESGTFFMCNHLRSISIPESVNYIDLRAFIGYFAKLTLPAHVRKVVVGLPLFSTPRVPEGSVTERTLQRAGVHYFVC